MPFTYLIEFKCLKEESGEADLQKALSEATIQLKRYVSDKHLRSGCAGTTLTASTVIYRKWDLACCKGRPVDQVVS